MVKPITPEQVNETRLNNIPDFVIDVVNQMLIEHGGQQIVLNLKDIKNRVRTKQQEIGIETPIGGDVAAGWYDFEKIYELAGWAVTFTKYPYYSSEPDYYTFRAR